MNKQEILDEINKTKEYLANMEKMLEEYEYNRWKPIDGELYYFVDSYMGIPIEDFCSADYVDSQRYKNYNCFQTREQAEQESEKILVRRMLEDIAGRLNKGKKPNWDNFNESKFWLAFNYNRKKITLQSNLFMKQQGTVYCLDYSFKDIAIREIGEERLKAYLRGE